MLRRYFLVLSLLALGSCAYALDDADQEIELLTPGSKNALCYVYVNKVKYKVRPPQTITIVKSKNDMVVDCMAPGNRRREVVIHPKIEESTAWNVTNGILLGAAWDTLSGAAFRYPDIIEVDFRYMEQRPQALPDQNSPYIKQPEEYSLEEFLPSYPSLKSDKFNPPTTIKRRENPAEGYGRTLLEPTTLPEEEGPVMMKGDLEKVMEMIGPDINPSLPAPSENEAATEGTKPLYPVE